MLPDSETNWLICYEGGPTLTLVAVPREGLAASMAAGLAGRGKKPLILIQNTAHGSGDSIRGWLLGLTFGRSDVGLRGWTRHGVTQDTAGRLRSAS